MNVHVVFTSRDLIYEVEAITGYKQSAKWGTGEVACEHKPSERVTDLRCQM